MGRFAIVLTCAVAVLATVPAPAGAQVLIASTCGSSCGSLDASGKGTLGINGNGAEWGSVASGTVKVEDKSHNGRKDYSLSGCDKRYRDPSDSAIVVCQADNAIYFSTSTVWWLQVTGTNVNASAVASGGVYIKGSGGYHRNGGSRRSWPSGGTFFQI
jgi:hypothetical protein